ncbi:hypothetical protein [Sphingopyxis panaciterrae]
MDIEIGRGLAEARRLASEHRATLAVYAGLGVVVPFLLLSSEPIFSLRTVMAIAADPWAFRFGGSIAGPLYLLGIVAVIVAGAMLAAWNALFAELREGYISEIMSGMVAGVAYLFANILLSLTVGFISVLPLILLAGATQWSVADGGPALEAYRFALSLAGSWIGVRFCLAGAIMGERGSLEPFSAFAESWRRTAPAQWRLWAFYLAYGLVFVIAFAGLAGLHGAIIVSNEPGGVIETAMSFGWVLVFAAYFLGQILIPAGLYRVALPRASAEVFA